MQDVLAQLIYVKPCILRVDIVTRVEADIRIAASSAVRIQTVAGAIDGKALLVQQIPDAADQQYFVMLIIATVCHDV